MSSEDNKSFSEPTLWVLLGTLVSAALTGIAWCVQKRCRRTHFAIYSGRCECSADSEILRRTIREEIHAERQERESKSEDNEDNFVLESPKPLRSHTVVEINPISGVNPSTLQKQNTISG